MPILVPATMMERLRLLELLPPIASNNEPRTQFQHSLSQSTNSAHSFSSPLPLPFHHHLIPKLNQKPHNRFPIHQRHQPIPKPKAHPLRWTYLPSSPRTPHRIAPLHMEKGIPRAALDWVRNEAWYTTNWWAETNSKTSPLFAVCRESRDELLKTYHILQGNSKGALLCILTARKTYWFSVGRSSLVKKISP